MYCRTNESNQLEAYVFSSVTSFVWYGHKFSNQLSLRDKIMIYYSSICRFHIMLHLIGAKFETNCLEYVKINDLACNDLLLIKPVQFVDQIVDRFNHFRLATSFGQDNINFLTRRNGFLLIFLENFDFRKLKFHLVRSLVFAEVFV